MPSGTSFHRSVPALHEFADINQLSKGNDSVKMQYKDFLRNYLEDIRGTKDGHGFKQVNIKVLGNFSKGDNSYFTKKSSVLKEKFFLLRIEPYCEGRQR